MVKTKAKSILLIMDLDGAFLYGDRQEEIIEHCTEHRIKFGFVTRRSYRNCRYPINIPRLYRPHFLACAAGTELWLRAEGGDYRQEMKYDSFVRENWPDREAIIRKLRASGEVESLEARDELRITCRLKKETSIDLLNSRLAAQPIRLEAAGFPHLDIVPLRGGKEGCLRYLASHYACPLSRVISCGNHMEDYGFLMQPHRGIVVANCDRRLYEQIKDEPGLYFATEAGSAGILEGMKYWTE